MQKQLEGTRNILMSADRVAHIDGRKLVQCVSILRAGKDTKCLKK